MASVLTSGLTLIALVGLLAGHFGALHPAADSLAVFRPYLAPVLVLLAVVQVAVNGRVWASFAAIGAVLAIAPLVWINGRAIAGESPTFSLYQKNMLFRMPDPAALGRDILSRNPDFVTLQEVSRVNLAVFETLGSAYATRHFCPFATVGGVAVASRWPMVTGTATCAEHDGVAALQVTTPSGPVWIISIHMYWPWPHQQPQQAARLLPVLESLDGPKVIGGDFNMVPWSHLLRQIAQASGTRLLGKPHITLVRNNGLLRVPIDHVLSTGYGDSERLPLLGSDHFGVLARIRLKP